VKILVLIARLLLGLMFVVFGSNPFLHFLPMTAPPGTAGQYLGVLVETHYVLFIGFFQVVCGLLLLANQYVPLALTILAAIIVNILLFHLLMAPVIALGLLAAVLWLIVAWSVRSAFVPLLQRQVATDLTPQ
jgi:putative oxidoreductase